MGSLFIKTGLSPLYVIEMIITFCVSLEFCVSLCNTFYNLKYTNILLRYSVAAPHGLCVLSHLFSVLFEFSLIVGNAHVQC